MSVLTADQIVRAHEMIDFLDREVVRLGGYPDFTIQSIEMSAGHARLDDEQEIVPGDVVVHVYRVGARKSFMQVCHQNATDHQLWQVACDSIAHSVAMRERVCPTN